MDQHRISFRKLHPLVKMLLIGTVVVSTVQSMCAPFFAVYLSRSTHISIGTIGFIAGSGALAGTVGGFVGGGISDALGRTRVMAVSLVVQAGVYAGYTFVRNPLLILLFMLLSGFFGSFFGPAAKAMMADITPQEKRVRVFSWQYVGTNIGYAVGPLVGISVGVVGGAEPFLALSMVYLVYLLVLLSLTAKYPIGSRTQWTSEPAVEKTLGNRRSFGDAWRVLKGDRTLLMFIFGGLMTTLVHGQWSTPISVFLTRQFTNGAWILSALLTTNALVVVLFQPLVSRWMGRMAPLRSVTVGGVLFAVGSILFALAGGWLWFVVGMVVFTIGEVFIVPSEYAMIDQITPENARGAYYGATSFTNLGSFFGPWLFSYLLIHLSGAAMFLGMAVCSLASAAVYRLGVIRKRGGRMEHAVQGHCG